jgi:hypothetical protein
MGILPRLPRLTPSRGRRRLNQGAPDREITKEQGAKR